MKTNDATFRGWNLSLSERKPAHHGGYVLYVVLTLLAIASIFAFSLSGYRSKAVGLLAKTLEHNRLIALAQSGATEILASVLKDANDSKSKFGARVRSEIQGVLGDLSPENAKFFQDNIEFSELPSTKALADETLEGLVTVRGRYEVCLNKSLKRGPDDPNPGFSGHLEIVVQAASTRDSNNMLEIKERRDIRIIFLRDFFDKYVFYVKNYCADYNYPKRRLVLQGFVGDPGSKTLSRVFFGSRFPPKCPEFAPYGDFDAPLYFDLNMKEHKDLLPLILEKEMKIKPGADSFSLADSKASTLSKGKFFHVGPVMDFKTIFSRGGFSDSDFYNEPQLQNQYLKSILEPAKKASKGEHVPQMILNDWAQSNGNFGNSQLFRQVVETCRNAWKYHYGYTDAENVWEGLGKLTELSNFYHFTGLANYPSMVANICGIKSLSGVMPVIFNPDPMRKIIVEGNVFFRFFKIALFDQFEVPMQLGPGTAMFGLAPLPLNYELPTNKANFRVRPVTIEGEENCIMSRSIEHIPVNKLYFEKLQVFPEGLTKNPEDAYPWILPETFSYMYKTPAEFRKDRIVNIDGKQTLLVDGNISIERDDLDLSDVEQFTGRGMVLINFKGDMAIGNLAKRNPSDSLRLWVVDGNFIIKSDKPKVCIYASLIALRWFGGAKRDLKNPDNQGKLFQQKKEIEITGNLILDSLYMTQPWSTPDGKTLTVIHDPKIYGEKDQDFYQMSISPIRLSYTINSDPKSRIIK